MIRDTNPVSNMLAQIGGGGFGPSQMFDWLLPWGVALFFVWLYVYTKLTTRPW
jgi:hypothetical protein